MKCSSLWHPQGHLSIVDCWEDSGKNPTESPERASWSEWTSTRKSMWIQEGQRNNRHGFNSKATPREMTRTNCGPLHDLCRPHQAFDTVSRDGLWKIMAKFGCPGRFIAMVRQFHDGMLVRVQNDGEYSEPFPVTNGVKQGCVLEPTLFSTMFSAMLTDAFQDCDAGFPIIYRFDGKLFNLRRFQAKFKVQTDVLDELLYADDMAKNVKTEKKCKRLWIDSHKPVTTMISQSARKGRRKCTSQHPESPTVSQPSQWMDKRPITYLGSTLSRQSSAHRWWGDCQNS